MIKLDTPYLFHPQADLYASGQPSKADLEGLKAQGVAAVINLRPDQETPDRQLKSEAEAAGLAYYHLPIAGGPDVTPERAAMLDQLLTQAPRPTLIFCGSSNRVGALMALRAAKVQGKPAQEALELGRAFGLTGLEAIVAQQLKG